MPDNPSSPAPVASPALVPATPISPIHAPKASEILATELRRRILDGSLADGTNLPSERDLVEQTGLSRGAVRQALRSLQAEGLVETRPGRFGGSVARRPGDDALARFLGLFVEGRAIPLLALLEFREMTGGPIAAAAARNRTASDLTHLDVITQRQEAALFDVPTFLAENVKWQIALARATHNELVVAFITAISGLILKATAIENVASEEVRRQVIKAHRTVLDAVVRGDADAASRRMHRHLRGITRDMPAMAKGPVTLA